VAKERTPFPSTCKSKTGNSPFSLSILEQRSCSENFPFYLLGGKGLLKIQKRTNLVRYKKKIAHTHTQQNKKPRVVIFI
jgi:hypothetical protein